MFKVTKEILIRSSMTERQSKSSWNKSWKQYKCNTFEISLHSATLVTRDSRWSLHSVYGWTEKNIAISLAKMLLVLITLYITLNEVNKFTELMSKKRSFTHAKNASFTLLPCKGHVVHKGLSWRRLPMTIFYTLHCVNNIPRLFHLSIKFDFQE